MTPFDLETATKEEIVDYARVSLELELDRTRRVDFLRGQVKNALRAKSSVAPSQPVEPDAPKFLRNRKTGFVFEATPLLLKHGDDLEPCDAEGNPL